MNEWLIRRLNWADDDSQEFFCKFVLFLYISEPWLLSRSFKWKWASKCNTHTQNNNNVTQEEDVCVGGEKPPTKGAQAQA